MSWLREAGDYIFKEQEPDPNVDFHILVSSQDGKSHVNIIFYKNKADLVTFISAVAFSEQDAKAYAASKSEVKNPFLYALESALLQLDVVFGYEPNHDNIKRVVIEKRLYFGALDRQRFFDNIHLMYRASTIVSANYSMHLHRWKQ